MSFVIVATANKLSFTYLKTLAVLLLQNYYDSVSVINFAAYDYFKCLSRVHCVHLFEHSLRVKDSIIALNQTNPNSADLKTQSQRLDYLVLLFIISR